MLAATATTNRGRRPKPVIQVKVSGQIKLGKACSVCSHIKPYDEYHKLWRSKDGHQPLCKKCKGKKNAKRYRGRIS